MSTRHSFWSFNNGIDHWPIYRSQEDNVKIHGATDYPWYALSSRQDKDLFKDESRPCFPLPEKNERSWRYLQALKLCERIFSG